MRVRLLISALVLCTSGCMSVRQVGTAAGNLAVAATALLAQGLVNGLLGDDDSFEERIASQNKESPRQSECEPRNDRGVCHGQTPQQESAASPP